MLWWILLLRLLPLGNTVLRDGTKHAKLNVDFELIHPEFMAAELNAVSDFVAKAAAFGQQTAEGWYKACEAMKLYPLRLAVLKQQANSWASLLSKYGMSADPFIQPVLEVALQLLHQEERRVLQLQQERCLTRGRKLVFPESLIGALDSVISAFQTLPDLVIQQEELRQQLEKASLYRVARLPFLPDSKYVPFEACIAEVRRALESETTGPVVVISGGPGQGKTSMAKYLACLYQDGINPLHPAGGPQKQVLVGTQIIASPKNFADGVFFLPCGQKADSKSLHLQLWQDVGYQTLPVSTDQSQASSQRGSQDEMLSSLASEDAVHKKLSARLANLNVLVVLDDVWDSSIINRLLVQQRGIKYLVTTQVPRLWTDATCADIPISLPTFQEANQILANHVRGFAQQFINSDIQDQINQIIEKSDSNPLVLANVATNISFGEALQLQEWKSALKYLSDLQDGDDRRLVTMFGRTYSKRTMTASIEMALSSFSNEEQTLLFLACICESQPIPEVVFKTLFKTIHCSLAKFCRCRERLEAINFIQIESKVIVPSNSILQKSWSLHSMRQNFIATMREQEISLIFSKILESMKNDNIVAILLILYGQEQWRSQAASTLQSQINLYVNDTSKLRHLTLLSVSPFVWLLSPDGEEDWQQQSHHATKKILEDWLLLKELNQVKVVELLLIKETISSACQALLQLAIFNQKPLFKGRNDHVLHTLMTIFCQTHTHSETQLKAVLYLLLKLSSYNFEDAITIGSYPGVVNQLVSLLGEEASPGVQQYAAWTLGSLSKAVVDNSSKIGSCPSVIEKLVGLLGDTVREDVQNNVAWALAYLSKDVVDNSKKIGSYPGAVERLVALLGEGVSSITQQHATSALAYLSKDVVDNSIKIGSYPGAVERLVSLLGEGVSSPTQHNAASTLAYLSQDVVDNSIKIGSYPGTLERLVALLGEGVKSSTQGNAAWALANLSKDVVNNSIRIGSYPGVVKRLVALLGEGVSPTTQQNAASAIGSLSKDVRNNSIRIGSYLGAIERLVALLGEGVSPLTQGSAAFALAQLFKDNSIKIASHPGVRQRLVALLQDGAVSLTPQVFALAYPWENVVDNSSSPGSFACPICGDYDCVCPTMD